MKPRLASSKKWTSFPKEYIEQIESVFKDNFAGLIGDAELIIEGRIYTGEILLRVGVHEKGRLGQSNFEVSMEYSQKAQDALERIHDCIDAAASMLGEYYQSSETTDFPRTWKEYEFNGRMLYLQFSTVNTKLEAEADAILGKSFEQMVEEDKATEDALDRAAERIESEEDDDVLNEDEILVAEEDEDDAEVASTPTILGGKKKKEDLH